MFEPLWPLLIYFGAVLTVVARMLGLSYILGQRHQGRETADLTLLREAIGQKKRPLIWLLNPNGTVTKANLPAQRDLKRAERQQVIQLRTPYKV